MNSYSSMPKKYDESLKKQAENLYVMQGYDVHYIGDVLGVHHTTVRRWAQEREWDDLRGLKNASVVRIGMQALYQMNKIYEKAEHEGRILNASETDQLAKLQHQIKKLDKDLDFVANAIEATAQFLEFVREKDESLFEHLTEYSVEFTQYIAKKYDRS